MRANDQPQETDLIDAAVAWLRERLPPTWEVQRTSREASAAVAEGRVDAYIDLRGASGGTTFAVEAKRSFSPRDVDRLLSGVGGLLRDLVPNIAVLVVAPWLSGRTQELLAERGVNYIDLTGNAFIRLDFPAVYIKTTGATRNPAPEPRGRARVRGPKAARLVRLLADVKPPYRVGELASSAQLAPGYVSRLLDALDREALIERSRRGMVESVDVPALLRRWAESYDVLKTNDAHRFIAPAGARQALERLADSGGRVAVTGSFTAVRKQPVAAPALLLAYADRIEPVARDLELLPADEGANVILLRPFDRVVWEQLETEDGLTYVAPSQAAVDCLTGPGRMPAEGEALLGWLAANEPKWRLNSLRLVEGEDEG
jgi:hypothetical protein